MHLKRFLKKLYLKSCCARHFIYMINYNICKSNQSKITKKNFFNRKNKYLLSKKGIDRILHKINDVLKVIQ